MTVHLLTIPMLVALAVGIPQSPPVRSAESQAIRTKMLLSAPAAGQPAPDGQAAALEREARTIETLLVAPCCWMQQVSEHQSEAADQVRAQIRGLLATGKTRPQVLEAFVAEYGPRILVEPPARGFGWWLYILPPAVFGTSALALFLLVRRMRARGDQDVAVESATAPDSVRDEDIQRLEDELGEME